MSEGWIGVDLDGTLAEDHGWQGIEYIGKPIPEMLKRVQKWLLENKRVKIFTARVSRGPKAIKYIEEWLKDNGLPVLEITNVKDYDMIELWDDRVVCVVSNKGIIKKYYKEDL